MKTNALSFYFIVMSLMILHAKGAALNSHEQIAIKLEFANTPHELAQGLMGRHSLDSNSGMLFSYASPKILSFWMLNTFIDLSLAFLDEHHVIREIRHMKSFPQKMLNDRKEIEGKENIQDSNHSLKEAFFLKNQVSSSFPATFALEVNQGWFEKNHIQIGDVVQWQPGNADAVIQGSNYELQKKQ